MSRSQPDEHLANPSTRWFEWQGELGIVRYYDKEQEKNVTVELPFTFILLDQLGMVKGWDESAQAGIYSNEVKDTRQETLIVKRYKGGTVAEGLYKAIKDEVKAVGGDFHTQLYLAYKVGHTLKLGALRLKGAALNAWVEFQRKHRTDIYQQAIVISEYDEQKKGKVVYRTPKFALKEISKETETAATALDVELQAYLKGYFSKTKRAQVEHVRDEDMPTSPPPATEKAAETATETAADAFTDVYDDDIPF